MLNPAPQLHYYPPSLASDTTYIKYIFCKALKKSEFGFSKNSRILWVDLQQLSVSYANYAEQSYQQLFKGVPPKEKASIPLVNLRFGEIKKMEAELKIQDYRKNKVQREWVLIFQGMEVRNRVFALMKVVKKYYVYEGAGGVQHKNMMAQIQQIVYATRKINKPKQNPPSLSIPKLQPPKKQPSQLKTSQKYQNNPVFILPQHPNEKQTKVSPSIQNPQIDSQNTQQNKSINSQKDQPNIQDDESIIDIIGSEERYSMDSRSVQGLEKEREMERNRNGNPQKDLMEFVESLEYQDDMLNRNSVPNQANRQYLLNDLSRIPLKKQDNPESMDSLHQQFLFNRQNTNPNLDNIIQKQQEQQQSPLAYIDWNSQFHYALYQQRTSTLYSQFIHQCRKCVQNHLTAILHTTLIQNKEYIRKGVRYTIKNLKDTDIDLYTTLKTYKEKHAQQYKSICEGMKKRDLEFQRNFRVNCSIMENLIENCRHQMVKNVVKPTLCCEIRYAYLQPNYYRKVEDWPSDRNIRNAVQKLESSLKINLNITQIQIHQQTDHPQIHIFTHKTKLPSIANKNSHSLTTLTKLLNQQENRQILITQICYPKILNILIASQNYNGNQNQNQNQDREYLSVVNDKLGGVQYWRKCVNSAYIAQSFCMLVRYEIFRAAIKYILGNYHTKKRGENSIEGVTAIIQITEFIIEDWVNILLSANGQISNNLWTLLSSLTSIPKQQTIPGIVLGCLMQSLSLKMWRYATKTTDPKTQIIQNLPLGKFTLGPKPIIDFPIELTYSYNGANILENLKTHTENESGVFSANIDVRKYSERVMDWKLGDMYARVLWELNRGGLMERWECELESGGCFRGLEEKYGETTREDNQHKILSLLEQYQKQFHSDSNQSKPYSHLSQEQTQQNPHFLQINPQLKLYLSTLRTSLSKTHKIYNFQELPLLQLILYKENQNLHKEQLQQFYKMLSPEQLEDLQQNYNAHNRSELYDCREIVPYFERNLISRYVVVVKKFLLQSNGYARYILNGIIQQCVFWLGQFSILLQPLYMVFFQHYYQLLMQSSPSNSQKQKQYLELCLKYYKSILYLNVVTYGSQSMKVGNMHLYFAQINVKFINMGYHVPAISNDTRTASKYDTAIFEILSALQCYDKNGNIQGYLQGTCWLGKINIMEKKYKRLAKNSIKPLLQPLNHIATTNKQLTTQQLSKYLNLIELIWRIYTLIDNNYSETNKETGIGSKYLIEKVSITLPEKQQLIVNYLCQVQFTLDGTKAEEAVSRAIKMILVYLKVADVINLGSTTFNVNVNADRKKQQTHKMKLYKKDRLINIGAQIHTVKEYLLQKSQEELTQYPKQQSFKNIKNFLSLKQQFVGHISANTPQKSPVTTKSCKQLYYDIIEAIDDIAYLQNSRNRSKIGKINKNKSAEESNEDEIYRETSKLNRSQFLFGNLIGFLGHQYLYSLLD